jgi:hypothetical protein
VIRVLSLNLSPMVDGANQPTSCAAQGRLAFRISPEIDGSDGIRSGTLENQSRQADGSDKREEKT